MDFSFANRLFVLAIILPIGLIAYSFSRGSPERQEQVKAFVALFCSALLTGSFLAAAVFLEQTFIKFIYSAISAFSALSFIFNAFYLRDALKK